jgi:putative transferase (TIGR04331 family)
MTPPGILKTLALDIPTLTFWSDGLDHVLAAAQPFYRGLIDAGIVRESAQSAAAKAAEVWNDVQGWWQSAGVQSARRAFCDRYARDSAAPVTELAAVLSRVRGHVAYKSCA